MLKPIEPNSSTVVIWDKDPAIVKLDEKYATKEGVLAEPSCWREMAEFREGHQPTEFVIGIVPSADMCRYEGEVLRKGFPILHWNCFLAGVRDIKQSGLGSPPKSDRDGIGYVDPEWLAKTFIGPLRECATFIGQVVHAWNTAQDTDRKNL